jgi:5-methylcytosine-specific restriction endonuclease McrA
VFVSDSAPPRKVRTRELVAGLLARGVSSNDVARILGVSKSTVCYHKGRLGLEIDSKFNRRYDWAEVQRYYDLGHTISECQARFGFARATFVDAAKRGDLKTRPHGAPIEVYLVRGRRTNRTHLKQRLLAEGLKEHRCERCGIESWLGEPLSMALHHVNGDGLDNRLENLVLLCPNCHAQTPNFSGRNRRLRAVTAVADRAAGVAAAADGAGVAEAA